jgi:hypothetical protein
MINRPHVTYTLLAFIESCDQQHVVDQFRTDRGLGYATAVLTNTHPRLCSGNNRHNTIDDDNNWSVVSEFDLDEAMRNSPRGLFA